MGARKLYGVIDSPSTMRALASLFEHDLEFMFVAMDLDAGDHEKESFLSLSPFGQVPVFQDDDLILFESRAIMRSISHVYPKPQKEQIYMEPKLQGVAAAWIDVEDHEFKPHASKLIAELLFKPENVRLAADEAVVAEAEDEMARVLDVYEERLKNSKYLGGDKFTSADLSHLPYLYYLMKTPAKRLFDDRLHVCAWCGHIMARPAWTKVVEMVEKNVKK